MGGKVLNNSIALLDRTELGQMETKPLRESVSGLVKREGNLTSISFLDEREKLAC